MSSLPYFSIIVPTYNRAAFIHKTITSLLNQTFRDFEILLIDDGSTDNTKEIISSLNDFRIKYFYKTNQERGAARNFGAKHAKGEYLNFFDSDDLAYPYHLQKAFELIQKNNAICVFHLGYDVKDISGNIISKQIKIHNIKEQLLSNNPISCNSVFIKKELFNKYKFNEDRKLSGSEDYLLWLQLSSAFPILSDNTITTTVIDHEDRSVLNFNIDKSVKRVNALLDYILKDKEINANYKNKIGILLGYSYSYIALHLIIKKQKKEGLNYIYRSIKYYPKMIFKKRFFAILKHLLLR